MNNLALVESKSLREEKINKIEVLDKVKLIKYMTDDNIVSVDQAANYYEVDKEAINSVIRRNEKELNEDGLRTLTGKELKVFKGNVQVDHNLKYTSHFRIIPRRALLRIGMLLRDSEIAKEVRNYLLNTEENSEIKTEALKAATESFKEIKKTLDEVAATSKTKINTLKSIYSQAGIDIPLSVDDINQSENKSNNKHLKKNNRNYKSRNPYLNVDLMWKIIGKHDLNITEAAHHIGLSRKHFSRLLNKRARAGKISRKKISSTFPQYKNKLFVRM